ncbi:formate dehydrogenase subunit delta [Novosphingobium aerophilum]|nr:formate dehydrogenase subunit delta [Novosphingobium aerophilum]
MSGGTTANLVRMANQIAANLAAHGADAAAAETAEHIARYWDPRMRAALREVDPAQLSAIARAAVARLDPAGAASPPSD